MDMNRISLNGSVNYICGGSAAGKVSAGSSALRKTAAKRDRVSLSDKSGKAVFSDALKKAMSEAASDIKKQASIERKNEIKSLIKSGDYTIDAAAIAARIVSDKFDLSI